MDCIKLNVYAIIIIDGVFVLVYEIRDDLLALDS